MIIHHRAQSYCDGWLKLSAWLCRIPWEQDHGEGLPRSAWTEGRSGSGFLSVLTAVERPLWICTAPFRVLGPRLCRREKGLSSKQPSFPLCCWLWMQWEPLLQVPCGLDIPTTTMGTWDWLWGKANPFAPALLFVGIFYDSDRNKIRAVT